MMKLLVRWMVKLSALFHSAAVSLSIEILSKQKSVHICELDQISKRIWSFLPDGLTLDNDYITNTDFETVDEFLRWRIENPQPYREVVICQPCDWHTDCVGIMKDMGTRSPLVLFADPSETSIDKYGVWAHGGPVTFYTNIHDIPSGCQNWDDV